MDDFIFVDTYCLAKGKDINTSYIENEMKQDNKEFLKDKYLDIDKQNILKITQNNTTDNYFIEKKYNRGEELINMGKNNIISMEQSKSHRWTVLKIAAACIVLALLSTLVYFKYNSMNDGKIPANNIKETVNPENTQNPTETISPTATAETINRTKITELTDEEFITLQNEVDEAKGKFDTTLECYIKYINQWNSYAINMLSYTDLFIVNQEDWNEIEGRVSADIVEDEDYIKLVKLTFNIDNPGNSLFSKGENIRYIYFSNYANQFENIEDEEYQEWQAHVISEDDNIPNEKPKYADKVEATYKSCIERYGVAYNGGLGYNSIELYCKNGIGEGKEIEIDINNDGEKEKISIETVNDGENYDSEYYNEVYLVINDKKKLVGWETTLNSFIIRDIDGSDAYKEILICDDNPSGSSSYKFYRYNNTNIVMYDTIPSNIDVDAISGNKMITSYPKTYALQAWYPTITCKAGENSFIYDTQWYNVESYDTYASIKPKCDITVYAQQSTSSKKIIVNKGETIQFTSIMCRFDETEDCFICDWMKIKTDDGTEAYIHLLDAFSIDNNGEELSAFDLYDNWRPDAG